MMALTFGAQGSIRPGMELAIHMVPSRCELFGIQLSWGIIWLHVNQGLKHDKLVGETVNDI